MEIYTGISDKDLSEMKDPLDTLAIGKGQNEIDKNHVVRRNITFRDVNRSGNSYILSYWEHREVSQM